MPELPDKLYYSIREIAEHTGVEPHVLRYWESEFPSLRPKRARSGARNYRRKDVEQILVIQRLLHEEGYRIEGARKHLRELKTTTEVPVVRAKPQANLFQDMDRGQKLEHVRQGLREVLADLAALRAGDD